MQCGWNLTLEGVSHGVLMICRPCFGDQFGTARYVCKVWRAGAEMEVESQLERGKIRAAIERLMDEKDGKEVRERTRDLKEMKGDHLIRRCRLCWIL